jgi:hypothetical protein
MKLIKPNRSKARDKDALDEGQIALLINKMKAMEKEFIEKRRNKMLVDGADDLVRKVVKVNEVEEFFRMMNEDRIKKAKDFDPEFLEFIY